MCMYTCVVRWTDACVVVDSIDAGRVVLTVVVFTVIWVNLTTMAFKTGRTDTATYTHTHTQTYTHAENVHQ